MFSLFRKNKKQLLTEGEQAHIVTAIQQAERTTSGEVRVYIESRCPHVNAADRASEIFFKLKMNKTEYHNGVLVYVAVTDKQMAVFGDEGIHKKVGGTVYWEKELKVLRHHFEKGAIAEGIAQCISEIGNALADHFPYNQSVDKNELPDDIVFGN